MYNNGYPYFSWEYSSSESSVTGSNTGNNILYDCSINETYENITTEIWKRILNNLPYLYKTKGTIRGLKALITCYGIPSTILYVKEYGGPDLNTASMENVNTYKFDNFTTVLPFYASQSINLDWTTSSLYSRYPSTLQIRFATTASTYTNLGPMSLVEVPNSWSLEVKPTGSNGFGIITFKLNAGISYISASTTAIPIYDNKYTFINLQRESASDGAIDQIFNIDAKKYLYGSILYHSTASLSTVAAQNAAWRSPGTLVIGGSGSSFANPFYGKIDEFRLWETPLIKHVIDTHVKFPESYLGNTLTGSYVDLLLRFAMDDPINMASFQTSSFINNAASQGYPIKNLKIFGWSNAPDFPYSFETDEYEGEAHSLNIGISRHSNNKVRIESGSLIRPLSSLYTSEVGQYDTAQIDSNKLGIYFSPTDLINEDIIKTLAVSDIGDLIGNPGAIYSESYSDLTALSNLYWKLGSNRISTFDYLKYIKYYDPSLFDHIREFIPARCQSVLGVMYEPNALERSKVKYIKPTISYPDYSDTIQMVKYNLTSSVNDYFVSISMDENILNNSFNFEKVNIYTIIDMSNNYSGVSGSVYYMINPVVDFDHSIVSITDYVKTSLTQSYSFTNGYQPRHYKNYEGFYSWEKRLKYEGCLQTSKTTVDQLEPIEVWETNPNRLTARDDGRSNLQVI